MQALDKKLIRDFKRLWKQALAIALVLACGVLILLTAFGMHKALADTRATYYERNQFADVFASARRVPNSLIPEIEAIEGVSAVQTRVVGNAILDLDGVDVSVTGRILSLPQSGAPRLNIPILQSGSLPSPTATSQVVVNAPFALANGLVVGDMFHANLNGQKRPLTIVGTALTPEFIYTIGPGAIMPNNETFGIIMLPQDAASAVFDMDGAFNDVAIKLTAGTTPQMVIDRLDPLLEPYGGLGAYGRELHQSDSFVEAEISQLRVMALILPPIFFGISAFLVSMVLGRIVALERSQIGLLKAIGYSNVEVCLHYLMLAALIAVVGILIGWGVGGWLARAMARQYAQFFDFPFLIYGASPWVYAMSGLAALLTTTIGAAQSALQAARLTPAVAMQPPAPPQYKRSIMDRAMAVMRLSQPTIMIFRSVLRWPLRSGMTILGLALASATVISPAVMTGALDKIIESAFYETNRQDGMLVLSNDMTESVIETAADLPAVLQAEGQQFLPVILRNGPNEKRVNIEARRPDVDLSRIIDTDGTQINVSAGGIVLSSRLAAHLGVAIGDFVDVQFLQGTQKTHVLRVSGVIEQYFGLGAYVDLEHINQLLRQSTRISVINVSLEDSEVRALHAALRDIPRLIGVIMMTDSRRSFSDTIGQNMTVMNTIYIVISLLITIGVAYNGARIQLSERSRELASLRILGFTRGEVSYILIGETMLLAVLAQPLGWLIGAQIAVLMVNGFSSDLYSIPLVLHPSMFAKASLVVLAASLASVLIVRRRLDRQDLVAVMKTRE